MAARLRRPRRAGPESNEGYGRSKRFRRPLKSAWRDKSGSACTVAKLPPTQAQVTLSSREPNALGGQRSAAVPNVWIAFLCDHALDRPRPVALDLLTVRRCV